MQNWAGNYTFQANRVERPGSVDEVSRAVAAATRVHAVGRRHSFTAIADAPGGVLVSLERMDRVLSVDGGARPTVTIEAGVDYGRLGPALHAAGWALPNLASLPHITVAGAVATATHGSGMNNGCLSTSVAALELVTADGDVRTFRRGDHDFDGVVVALGSLGVVTKLTLDLVPAFDVEQHVYRNVPAAAVADNYEAIVASAYSVSVFTSWQTEAFEQVWMKCLPGRPHFDLRTIGGTPATEAMHPIEHVPGAPPFVGNDPARCTAQLGVSGPWHARLPHFRLEHTPSSGEEIQSEFFVARADAKAAIAAIAELRDDIRPLIQVSELRTIAADRLWLSPFYERPSIGIHFTWRREPEAVFVLTAKIEARLSPFAPRVHWAKVSTLPAATSAERYRNLDAFRRLRRRLDPAGSFLNSCVSPVVD